MSLMTTSDWRRVSGLVHTLHEADRDMPSAVLADLGALVGCDVASYNAVDHVEKQLLQSVTVPHTSSFFGLASFHEVFAQHPGFSAYRDGRLASGQAAAWSDLLDRRALRRLPLFVDFFQPRNTQDQLISVVRLQRYEGAVLAFNRSRRGFSGRERDIVQTLVSHLRQAVLHRERGARLTAALRRADRDTERRRRATVRLPALTGREEEVVAGLVDGLSDRDIAHALKISERTVHKHLEHIYRKLGLNTRAQVAAMVHHRRRTGAA
jgi:DNA-binding CsgD family transcriptional regulator